MQRRGERLARQLGERERLAAGPRREDEGDGQPLQPPREVDEEAQRRLVGPVRVVDREQQRPALGEVDGEPVQAVGDAEPEVDRLRVGGDRQRGRGERRRAREQAVRPRRGQRALEQLARDAVGEAALQLRAAGGDRLEPERAGALAGGLQQPGLADPGRTLQHDDPARAVAGGREHAVEPRELHVAFDQLSLGRRLRHPAEPVTLRPVRPARNHVPARAAAIAGAPEPVQTSSTVPRE